MKDQCLRIPARARPVPQSEIDELEDRLEARREWMREQKRREAERLIRLQAARDAAAAHFFARRDKRPDNVTPIEARR